MYIEQQLKEIAYQYLLAKDPEEYINNVLFEKSLPDSFEAQDMFKTTEVYKALAFNPKDNAELLERKQKFIDIYVDILKASGLALQSSILYEIDQVYVLDINDSNYDIAEYFENGYFMSKIQSFLATDDNLIDKASFIITQGKFTDEDYEALVNIKNFFVEILNHDQSKIQYVKYDLKFDGKFNYSNIDDIILPIYESASNLVGKDFVENDPQLKQVIQKAEQKDKKQKLLTAKSENKYLSLEEALDKNFKDLIGLKDVKNAILGKTKLILKVPNKAIACNFRIVGNPGVGKTTVAEAMSKTFYDAGIIKNKEFVSINGAELKAEYVGQTTGRVKEFFQKAHGGTLFLDEVYSLLAEEGGGDSFTNEAITQLMTEIEGLYNQQLQNPDDKTLVIMAGYKDKVKKLMDKNIGFRRRFPNILELRDYNLEELKEIFDMFMKKDGFSLEDDAQAELSTILEREMKKENFSNAGYVRNLLQSAEEQQARRADLKDFIIRLKDLKLADKALLEDDEKGTRIGF